MEANPDLTAFCLRCRDVAQLSPVRLNSLGTSITECDALLFLAVSAISESATALGEALFAS